MAECDGTKQSLGFLTQKPYHPPSWASQLDPIPSRVFSLAHLPTPIHKWNLPNLPKNIDLWIKRDDLTGMQLSGNKVRKLEFLMADAISQGADCIITIGGIQSNHCRATAVAAKYLNLDCYLILRTSKDLADKDPGLTGNLLVERLVGAHVELVSKEEYSGIGSEALTNLLREKLISQGRKPYIIPLGGSNSLGTWAYIEVIREIEEQLHTAPSIVFEDIVVGCGSGATVAGLSLGSWLSKMKAKVHGFSVCDDPDYFYNKVQGLLDGLHAGVSSRDIVDMQDSKGLGYAMNTTEELEFVKKVAATTGVVLDPVYRAEVWSELEVNLPAEDIWAVYSSPDLPRLIVELMPARFQRIDVLEGDGTQGTILHITLQPTNSGPLVWNEQFTTIDHTNRIKVVRQIEGGFLDIGFNNYENIFTITSRGPNACTIRATAAFDVKEGFESNTSLITANWRMARIIVDYVRQQQAAATTTTTA